MEEGGKIAICDHCPSFTSEEAFSSNASQDEVFYTSIVPLLARVIEGFNASVLAYGQTGTGMTYTMRLGANTNLEQEGILPQAVQQLFTQKNIAQKKRNSIS